MDPEISSCVLRVNFGVTDEVLILWIFLPEVEDYAFVRVKGHDPILAPLYKIVNSFLQFGLVA